MTKKEKMQNLKVFAAKIRLETLKIIASRGFGHVGGSMSMADAMAVLYGDIMNIDPKNPRWEERDWFVLSKGHGGPVMYATLGLRGYYPVENAQPAGDGFPVAHRPEQDGWRRPDHRLAGAGHERSGRRGARQQGAGAQEPCFCGHRRRRSRRRAGLGSGTVRGAL